uniref:Uncharacterized protein n=1 Tax=Arundo donax TaxID=35708 RepID=A0A0A8YUX3_ARUDO
MTIWLSLSWAVVLFVSGFKLFLVEHNLQHCWFFSL